MILFWCGALRIDSWPKEHKNSECREMWTWFHRMPRGKGGGWWCEDHLRNFVSVTHQPAANLALEKSFPSWLNPQVLHGWSKQVLECITQPGFVSRLLTASDCCVLLEKFTLHPNFSPYGSHIPFNEYIYCKSNNVWHKGWEKSDKSIPFDHHMKIC